MALDIDPPNVPAGCRLLRIDMPGEDLRQRYLGQAERAIYLMRTDQHVCGRWADASESQITRALDVALGRSPA